MSKIILNHPFFPQLIETGFRDHSCVLVEKLTAESPELKDATAILSLLSCPIDRHFIAQAPNLKVIANYAVGYDNIDLQACAEKGIYVTNTPDVLTNATAELALSLVFACARHIAASDRFCREDLFKGWKPDLFIGKEIRDLQACIVGKGRIGRRTAELFKAIGMHVTFITRQTPEEEIQRILKQSDVLSLHIPYRAELHHWLNKERLDLLPKDAILINTARGKVIDEQALIHKLKQGHLFAALDVYEFEPSIPNALKHLDNCTLIPHTGSATYKARYQMLHLSIQAILDSLKGKKPKNCLT